jgi:hypothetical protein
MNSSTKNIEALIKDEMIESGIVSEKGNTMSYFLGDREYLVSVLALEITDWENEN